MMVCLGSVLLGQRWGRTISPAKLRESVDRLLSFTRSTYLIISSQLNSSSHQHPFQYSDMRKSSVFLVFSSNIPQIYVKILLKQENRKTQKQSQKQKQKLRNHDIIIIIAVITIISCHLLSNFICIIIFLPYCAQVPRLRECSQQARSPYPGKGLITSQSQSALCIRNGAVRGLEKMFIKC